ncbi:winged helix-turn-helix domain-containing protein [Salinispira pacifica]
MMSSYLESIGEAAGDLWRTLQDHGAKLSATQLRNRTELPEHLLFAGLGWLAREGKIGFSTSGKKIEVFLK